MFFKNRRHHKSHLHYLTLLKGAIGMLRDPDHTESVFDIEDGMRDHEATKLAMEHVRTDRGVARMIEERYLAPPPDMDRLLRLPEGSLGYCYSHELVDQGFDPDYYRKIDVKDDIDYVLMRLRQTHDIWHVITGIANDRIGEIGVKAVELAQTHRPMAAVITTGGIIRYMVKNPADLVKVLERISYGYRLGIEAKPFLAQKWEENWEKPVAEWRAELNVNVDSTTKNSQVRKADEEKDLNRTADLDSVLSNSAANLGVAVPHYIQRELQGVEL